MKKSQQSREYKLEYINFNKNDILSLLDILFAKIDTISADDFSDINDYSFRIIGFYAIELCISNKRRKIAKEIAQKLVYAWKAYLNDEVEDELFDRVLPLYYKLEDFGFKKEAEQLKSEIIRVYTNWIREERVESEYCTRDNDYWNEIYELSNGELRKNMLKASLKTIQNDPGMYSDHRPFFLKKEAGIEALLKEFG